MNATAARNLVFRTAYQAAMEAGRKAAEACCPTPMTVVEHVNPLDDNSPIIRNWHVPDGVCGFAWVVIKPGTCSFARWLVKNGLAKAHYYGGVQIWIGEYNQSMQKKEAHARAMAAYLRKVGIKAFADSRMD